ncbi:hypothetical protein G9C98_008132 [Cotesia typhae]|uniref:HMG box domain-containing protein n=1 Tax=Cotesia typhae TaxID=2053667 RepID=A0A8J5RGR5_9HYME|nr:hypothetical protein G9C98_008132 [Cotesia typhae]
MSQNSRRSDATSTGENDNNAVNGEESVSSMTIMTASQQPSNVNGEGEDFSGNRSPYSESAEDKADSAGDKKSLNASTNNVTPVNKNKSKKRKKTPRDATAPKQPLTGYFRFLNDRRDKVRNENPNMSFADITKALAAEWSSLPADQKQLYLVAAEQDKERYNREYSDYKQTEAYRLFSEKQTMEKINDKKLRKATSDCESQNAVLQRHVDSLHAAVNRLESETNQQRTTNQSLQRHFDILRNQLASCFASVPLKGTHDGANLQNIDSYIERLEFLFTSGSNSDTSFRNAVQNAIAQFDLIG